MIESTLSLMLEHGLEENTFQSLRESLEGPASVSPAAAGALVPAGSDALGVASGGQPGSLLPAFGGFRLAGLPRGGGALGGGGNAAAAGLAAQRSEEAWLEQLSLLNILILIYYHPRKQVRAGSTNNMGAS